MIDLSKIKSKKMVLIKGKGTPKEKQIQTDIDMHWSETLEKWVTRNSKGDIMEEHKVSIEPRADGYIVKVDGKKYPPVRGNYFTAESDKIYAVEYSLKIHHGISYKTNFRCEIDLDKELVRVYYPILKVTWKEAEALERQKLELRG